MYGAEWLHLYTYIRVHVCISCLSCCVSASVCALISLPLWLRMHAHGFCMPSPSSPYPLYPTHPTAHPLLPTHTHRSASTHAQIQPHISMTSPHFGRTVNFFPAVFSLLFLCIYPTSSFSLSPLLRLPRGLPCVCPLCASVCHMAQAEAAPGVSLSVSLCVSACVCLCLSVCPMWRKQKLPQVPVFVCPCVCLCVCLCLSFCAMWH